MCASEQEALTALRTWVARWIHEQLPNAAESVTRATRLVDDACLAWGVESLAGPAHLVMTELAGNAVEHTTCDIEVTAALTGKYLRLAVEDSSTLPPRLVPRPDPDLAVPGARGNGLHLVRAAATHWGTFPTRDGKVVWALFAIPRTIGRATVDLGPSHFV